MSEIRQLKHGYANIAEAKTSTGAASAYGEFHYLIEETQPDPEVLAALVTNPDQLVLKAIERVRHGRIYQSDSYFRGSGIVVVGNNHGELLAVDYQAGSGDPVAEKYPNYQRVALRKTGLALLAARLGLGSTVGVKAYELVQNKLEELGLSSPKNPHHLGYGLMRPPKGNLLTAGASGMLPAEAISQNLHNEYAERFNQDKARGWYDWELDEAAGLHDLVAAQSTLLHLTRTEQQFPHDLLPLSPLSDPKVNVH